MNKEILKFCLIFVILITTQSVLISSFTNQGCKTYSQTDSVCLDCQDGYELVNNLCNNVNSNQVIKANQIYRKVYKGSQIVQAAQSDQILTRVIKAVKSDKKFFPSITMIIEKSRVSHKINYQVISQNKTTSIVFYVIYLIPTDQIKIIDFQTNGLQQNNSENYQTSSRLLVATNIIASNILNNAVNSLQTKSLNSGSILITSSNKSTSSSQNVTSTQNNKASGNNQGSNSNTNKNSNSQSQNSNSKISGSITTQSQNSASTPKLNTNSQSKDSKTASLTSTTAQNSSNSASSTTSAASQSSQTNINNNLPSNSIFSNSFSKTYSAQSLTNLRNKLSPDYATKNNDVPDNKKQNNGGAIYINRRNYDQDSSQEESSSESERSQHSDDKNKKNVNKNEQSQKQTKKNESNLNKKEKIKVQKNLTKSSFKWCRYKGVVDRIHQWNKRYNHKNFNEDRVYKCNQTQVNTQPPEQNQNEIQNISDSDISQPSTQVEKIADEDEQESYTKIIENQTYVIQYNLPYVYFTQDLHLVLELISNQIKTTILKRVIYIQYHLNNFIEEFAISIKWSKNIIRRFYVMKMLATNKFVYLGDEGFNSNFDPSASQSQVLTPLDQITLNSANSDLFSKISSMITLNNGSRLQKSQISWIKMRNYPLGVYYITQIQIPLKLQANSHILIANQTKINIYYKQNTIVQSSSTNNSTSSSSPNSTNTNSTSGTNTTTSANTSNSSNTSNTSNTSSTTNSSNTTDTANTTTATNTTNVSSTANTTNTSNTQATNTSNTNTTSTNTTTTSNTTNSSSNTSSCCSTVIQKQDACITYLKQAKNDHYLNSSSLIQQDNTLLPSGIQFDLYLQYDSVPFSQGYLSTIARYDDGSFNLIYYEVIPL